MIRVLLTGQLHADPVQRTSANGNAYTTAKLKADASDGAQVWCSLIAFAEVGERLATLKANAAISVSGRAKLSAWIDKNGNPAAGLDVTIDEISTLRGKPKPQGQDAAQTRTRPTRQAPHCGALGSLWRSVAHGSSPPRLSTVFGLL